ncbi:MAG: hypothetical protein OHK0029_31680 [Armatimonadaceae bacterium]
MAVEVVHRPLTLNEARRIHRELKTTPNILGYTVRELRQQRDLFAAEVDNCFAGICFNTDLPLGWSEVAVLYVLPEFQGQGIGRTLFTLACARCHDRGRHTFVLSRNPTVVRWMEETGFAVAPASWRAPLAFHLYGFWYMSNLYRWIEAFRICGSLRNARPMMQGIRKHTTIKSAS